jgi:hypothetical protein
MQFPKVGDKDAAETYLTNYLTLGRLVDRYNNSLKTEERKKFTVDDTVVRFRDSFAHGRLVTTSEFPATLWKFGTAKDGRVPVEYCEELTLELLKEKVIWIDRQRQNVVDCFKARGYQGLR